ncbi:MAG: hypothetical protein HYU66_15425 [Armatimonadetes bacterium]|nr:hypothetical protein [Armatimonadota bacterium]
MLQCTCNELLAHPGGLDEVLLLDTPTDPVELASLLFGWFVRSAPGGTCLIYLRDPAVAGSLSLTLGLALTEVAADEDATWYELRRPAFADKYDQLAAFTGETRLAAALKCREGIDRTKRAWEAADTVTAEGRRQFYGSTDAYLYELVEYEVALPPELPAGPAEGRHFELAHGTGRVLLGIAQGAIGCGYDLSEVLRWSTSRTRAARSSGWCGSSVAAV